MSYKECVPVNAGADLSAAQYKAVAVAGTIAASTGAAIGLLQNKPKSGEDGSACFLGRSRYVAGAAVAANAQLIVTTSGFLITAASGTQPCGKAIGAVSSGGIGEAIINFAGNGATVA